VNIAKGEATEKELDQLITRRDEKRQQTEGERLEEELYEPSVRAWHLRQEAEKRSARFEYHRGQAERLRRTLGELVAYHESAAERYLQDEPKGAA
jgi:hypothetical protein